jgi:hypothetical protein
VDQRFPLLDVASPVAPLPWREGMGEWGNILPETSNPASLPGKAEGFPGSITPWKSYSLKQMEYNPKGQIIFDGASPSMLEAVEPTSVTDSLCQETEP